MVVNHFFILQPDGSHPAAMASTMPRARQVAAKIRAEMGLADRRSHLRRPQPTGDFVFSPLPRDWRSRPAAVATARQSRGEGGGSPSGGDLSHPAWECPPIDVCDSVYMSRPRRPAIYTEHREHMPCATRCMPPYCGAQRPPRLPPLPTRGWRDDNQTELDARGWPRSKAHHTMTGHWGAWPAHDEAPGRWQPMDARHADRRDGPRRH